MRKRSLHTKGFSLLELMLVVGLLALLLVSLYAFFDEWNQKSVNRTAATEMMRVQSAAQDYVRANFEIIKNSAENTFVEIDINDLKNENYLPTGFVATNIFRQQIRVFRRILGINKTNNDGSSMVDDQGNAIRIKTIEVVTLSGNPPTGGVRRISNKRLVDIAHAGGPQMGVMANMALAGNTFNGYIKSVFGEWSLNRSDLVNAGYTVTTTALEGYIAVYGRVNTEATDANDQWLYRTTIDNRPDLNRMQTNLHMNANGIENVNTFVADKVVVASGNAAFLGKEQGGSSNATAQAMTVERALQVNGNGQNRINMTVQSGNCSFTPQGANRTLSGSGACTIAGGEIQVIAEADSGGNAGDATLSTENLATSGSVITDFTNVANATNVNGVSTFTTVEGKTLAASTTVIVPDVTLSGGRVNTSELQVSQMSVTNGATIDDQIVAARIAPGTAHGVTATDLEFANAAEMSGTLKAGGINASQTLYLDDITTGYYDTILPQNVACTVYRGNTYCEPRGRTFWQSNSFYTDCWGNATGYKCNHFRRINTSWVAYGQCTYTRSVDSAGKAYHISDCVPL